MLQQQRFEERIRLEPAGVAASEPLEASAQLARARGVAPRQRPVGSPQRLVVGPVDVGVGDPVSRPVGSTLRDLGQKGRGKKSLPRAVGVRELREGDRDGTSREGRSFVGRPAPLGRHALRPELETIEAEPAHEAKQPSPGRRVRRAAARVVPRVSGKAPVVHREDEVVDLEPLEGLAHATAVLARLDHPGTAAGGWLFPSLPMKTVTERAAAG